MSDMDQKTPSFAADTRFGCAGVGPARERAEALFIHVHPHDAHTFSPERREEIIRLATEAIEAIDLCDAHTLMNVAGNA